MKVLFQQWKTKGGSMSSISKDMVHYQITVRGAKTAGNAEPDISDPLEVEISDDHPLARLVEKETVFLSNGEVAALRFLE